MSNCSEVALSRFLSLVLRHEPERLGLSLDAEGWLEVERLLSACQAHGLTLTRERLEHLVASSDKQRFAFDASRQRIRANQGHSLSVDLGLAPQVPPETLYHGTVIGALPSIREHGLVKGERHHVHLSLDEATARKVGERRGQPVVLTVNSGAMHKADHLFMCSANGVWLVDSVPPGYLGIPDPSGLGCQSLV